MAEPQFEYEAFKAKVAELEGVISSLSSALNESHAREFQYQIRAERWKGYAKLYRTMAQSPGRWTKWTWQCSLRAVANRIRRDR